MRATAEPFHIQKSIDDESQSRPLKVKSHHPAPLHPAMDYLLCHSERNQFSIYAWKKQV